MLRKFCLIGTVVAGFFFLPLQATLVAPLTVLPLIPVASTSTTVEQIPVASTSIGVSAASFTLIPVANTSISVTQHGGRSVSHQDDGRGEEDREQHRQAAKATRLLVLRMH